jgi:hypothetical protein
MPLNSGRMWGEMMREFRIECIAIGKGPKESAWEIIAEQAQTLLSHFAPNVDFRHTSVGWEHNQDEWHHWNAIYDEKSWIEEGTFIFATLATLMLRDDPDLAGFAASLYYRDDGGDWLECG